MGTFHRRVFTTAIVSLSLLLSACQNDPETKPTLKNTSSPVENAIKPMPLPGQSDDDSADAGAEMGSGGKDSPDVGTNAPSSTSPKDPEGKPPVISDSKSEGCSASTELLEGETKFKVGTLERKFVVRKPKGYTKDKTWPLVLALHPNGSNTSYWDGTSGDRAIRKLFGDKAIIIVAQARVDDWRGDLPAELAYFDAMLLRAKKELCIDSKKIFAMGFSGGGSFSGVLGCSRSDIRAIASGGAVIYYDPKTCVGTPAAWVTIGDKEAEKGRLDFRDFWKDYNKCSAETKVMTPATCVEYSCPDASRPTQFCSHAGGHEWPSFGSQSAWDFFSRF
jgi:polyhydroxybutyrate depolymerase